MVRKSTRKELVFARMWLRPSQLRTVADRRYDDAKYLAGSGSNARANGAIYLGGYVVECFLKARLLEKHRWLQSTRNSADLADDRKPLWFLCYRQHDLDELLDRLPEVWERLEAWEQRGSNRLSQSLKQVCETWAVYGRYATRSYSIGDANTFLGQVKELKSCLS